MDFVFRRVFLLKVNSSEGIEKRGVILGGAMFFCLGVS